MSVWPGAESKRQVLTKSEATVGRKSTLKTLPVGRLPVGIPGVWLLCHPARPIFQEALQPK